jgi:hypothetical protein
MQAYPHPIIFTHWQVAKNCILGKPGTVVSVGFARGEMAYKVSLTRERIFPVDAKSSPNGKKNEPGDAASSDFLSLLKHPDSGTRVGVGSRE